MRINGLNISPLKPYLYKVLYSIALVIATVFAIATPASS
jgi:hypothetical protein